MCVRACVRAIVYTQERKSDSLNAPSFVGRSAAYNVWMSTLTADTRKPTPVRYAYTSSTSSKGLDSVDAGTLQFAALTSAPTKKAMDAMPKLWAVPSVGGAVAIVFNVPGIAALKVSRENLAGVFLGKIRVWSELAKDNPSLANVTEKISLIVRGESSSSSEVLTSALSSFSAEWKGSVGTSTRPKWPVSYKQYIEHSDLAIGVRLAEYSLGYTSVENVDKFQLPVARISNAAGRFVLPTYDAVAAAMSAFAPAFADHVVAGNTTIFFTPIVDPPVSAPDGYPIAAFVYVAFDTERLSCSTLFNVLYFVYWSWDDANAKAIAIDAGLVPVSAAVQTLISLKLKTLSCLHKKENRDVVFNVSHILLARSRVNATLACKNGQPKRIIRQSACAAPCRAHFNHAQHRNGHSLPVHVPAIRGWHVVCPRPGSMPCTRVRFPCTDVG